MAERPVASRQRAYRRGHHSEWLAAAALMVKGYRILARRHRTRFGEIDLIARRGDLVLIVEVKARRTLMEAMEAVATTRSVASKAPPIFGYRDSPTMDDCRCVSTWSRCCHGAGRYMSRMFFMAGVECLALPLVGRRGELSERSGGCETG